MDFHLEFFPRQLGSLINHQHKLLLVGSCFTENIGSKLKQHKFSVLENPNGILFNPVSIANSLSSYIEYKQYASDELFFENEAWHSWQYHSRFSNPDKNAAIQNINQSQAAAHLFLKQADWILITLGSAFVYITSKGESVANCHKVSTDKFNKHLLGIDEVILTLNNSIQQLLQFNPKLKIIFTISPVRHLRDGFVENNRSKATLIHAVHQLVNQSEKFFYFPAYELVIDDLRDYRFYAEDMVHPNYAATNYVWDKFISTCIDEPSQKLMKTINEINAAKNHKAFNPTSSQHKKFLQTNLEKVQKLQEAYPYINFNEEVRFFS